MTAHGDNGAAYGRNYIRNRREALGLSQEKLAEDLGVSAMTISRWENTGVCTLQDLGRLAELLQCKPAELVIAPERTHTLTPEEEALLLQYRAVSTGEQRSIATLARALAEQQLRPGMPRAAGE